MPHKKYNIYSVRDKNEKKVLYLQGSSLKEVASILKEQTIDDYLSHTNTRKISRNFKEYFK